MATQVEVPVPAAGEMIHIHHPASKGHAQTTRAAYEELWKDKGWEISTPGAVRATAVKGEFVATLDELNTADLEAVTASTGRRTTARRGRRTKAQIAAEAEAAATAAEAAAGTSPSPDTEQAQG